MRSLTSVRRVRCVVGPSPSHSAFAGRGVTYRQEATRESAEEALRQRFAQGEIGEEQFAETLSVLRESR